MKMFGILAAVTLAVFVSMGSLALAEGTGKSSMDKSSNVLHERSDYVGAAVKNLEGEKLGTVRDVVTDSGGNTSFVIVSHGGFLGYGAKETAIPFEALTYKSDSREFAIDLTEDRLDSAPRYAKDIDLNDRNSAEAFYRFYGITPPWGGSSDLMRQEDSLQHDQMQDEPMRQEPMGPETER